MKYLVIFLFLILIIPVCLYDCINETIRGMFYGCGLSGYGKEGLAEAGEIARDGLGAIWQKFS